MRIALAQMNTRLGDFEGTVEKMVAETERARSLGCDLTVFPMPVLTGYDLGVLADTEPFMRDVASALEAFSERAATPALVPFSTALGGSPTTEVGFIRDGEMVPLRMAAFIKSMMSQGLLLGEEPKASFALGDMEFAVCTSYASLQSFAAGSLSADVVVYLPFDPFETDDESTALAPSLSDGAFVRTATNANSWLVAVGAVGGWDDVVYTGGSFVLTPWGELAAVAPSFEEHLLVTDIDLLMEGPLEEHVEAPQYRRKSFIWDALSLAMRDFADKQDAAGVALCLTGDLLSAALAVLASDALGPTRVHGLIPPFLPADALADAREVAKRLGIGVIDFGAVEAAGLARVLSRGFAGSEADAPFAADPALFCGAWLLGVKREGALIPLTSADKTALALGQDPDGYSSASYAPFRDVYRSDLVSILPERNLVSPVVPQGPLRRLSVPEGLGLEELAPTDERRLSVVDAALLTHIEHGHDLLGMVDHGIDAAFAERLLARLDASELVRRECPTGPVVSDCALVERERPVPCAWHERLASEPPEEEPKPEESRTEHSFESPIGLSVTLPEDMLRNLPGDVLRYLKDFASGGGFDATGDDIWGQGLFSKN